MNALPDTPDTLGDDIGGYRQRWAAGAFGARGTIEGIKSFRVLDDQWTQHPDGTVVRTIIKAEVA